MSYLTLAFNPEDIERVLASMYTELNYLVAALIVALVLTVGLIFVKALNKPLKSLVRGTTWIAFALVVIMVINMILSGPMYSIVNMFFSTMERQSSGTADASGDEAQDMQGIGQTGEAASSLTAEVIADATELCIDLAREGIVLLENDGILPLAEGTKVNTFGWSSTNPIYGGVGSGALSQQYPIVSYLQGLEHGGLVYNTALTDWYTTWRAARPNVGMWSQDWTCPEPTQAEYEAANIYADAANFSDTVLFIVSRSGGEGADLPTSYGDPLTEASSNSMQGCSEYADDLDASKHYLELTNREIATLTALNEKFDNIIVIINVAAAMELGFVEEYENIRAVVLVPGGPGQSGFNALGELLTGKTNFSGKTADTYLYDLTTAPNWNNFGHFEYTNMSEFVGENPVTGATNSTTPTFVNYNEGIYVGYRFWETAADEGKIDYDSSVKYSFGYGLSYTTFEQKLDSVNYAGDTVTVTVTVTNTGDVAGKDIVQVYYNPPYTNGGIEKSTANLIAFDKTALLEPGAKETITLSWDVTEMASYDDTANNGAGAYVTEAGDYVISINSDSHNIIAEETITVTSDIIDRTSDVVKASNQFQYAEDEANITYLSRKDGFANYDEAVKGPSSYEMSDSYKAGFYNAVNYIPTEHNDESDEMPATGVDSGLLLQDMRGVAYDDPAWDIFLNQLTVEDMVSLISIGGYQSTEVRHIGKTQQIDCDGPASINNNFTSEGSIGFTSAVILACTWNTDLAYAYGEAIGTMADMMDVSGWYAPAMNIHRSAFSGRNFEYPSEDPYLSGMISANEVAGAESKGVYSFIKHFALNDQETNRCNMVCTWSTEQAAREIYMKSFEIAVKVGGADAVMSSFNYIGNIYAGACDQLLNKVLRDEWGFIGMVLTDYFGGYGYQDADIQIRNGGDICLSPMGGGTSILDDQSSATAIKYARLACKNILYTTANCRDYADGADLSTPTWQTAVWAVSAVLALALVGVEALLVKKYLKASKAAA